MVYPQHSLFVLRAYRVPKQVYRDYVKGLAGLVFICLVGILRSQVFAEAHDLVGLLGPLQLYAHLYSLAAFLNHFGVEVEAQQVQVAISGSQHVVISLLYAFYLLVKQAAYDDAAHALVRHQVFEHFVVCRVCYYCHMVIIYSFANIYINLSVSNLRIALSCSPSAYGERAMRLRSLTC